MSEYLKNRDKFELIQKRNSPLLLYGYDLKGQVAN